MSDWASIQIRRESKAVVDELKPDDLSYGEATREAFEIAYGDGEHTLEGQIDMTRRMLLEEIKRMPGPDDYRMHARIGAKQALKEIQ